MKRTGHVAFLLHMHQPQYVDPRTGRAELPWVRLHATRAYLDVARMLERHPGMRLTVNFVPSLVQQLEEVVAGARDAWLRVAEKPTRALTPDEREFLVARFFSLNWGRLVEPRPRYRELLDKRGRDVQPHELRSRAQAFTDADLRDLTVLFYLAWIGFAAREGDHELAELERKGGGYTEEDLHLVVEKQRAACAQVLPAWRALAERGQVELSSSPYYHPILPLVIDTETARRARPDLPLPEPFAWAEDARAQVRRGAETHQRAFGAPPAGMWPPEGSVSPEAVQVYEEAGVRWLATDEGNLWRSLQASGDGQVGRGALYRPWRFGGVDLVFRDRELSDRIGFAYAHGDSEAGARDLIERARACAEASEAPDGDPPLVPVFLDGENPWEAYPGSGEPFLRALFGGLERDGGLRPVSIHEHLQTARTRGRLRSLHSGSWIDSDFHIWIGDPVKNRAWSLLGRVRRQLERARGRVAEDKLAAAYEHVLAAEGSDWFWWFGEPFNSAEDAIFDRIFRAHLAGALEALGEPVPEELEQPVEQKRGAQAVSALQAPYALIRPRIGDATFYAWHGAGRYEVPRGAAMADSPLVERIHFGFDRQTLYLRLDPAPAAQLEGATVEVDVVAGDLRRRLALGPHGWVIREPEGDGWRELATGGPTHFARTIEAAVPFERLHLKPGTAATLAFRLSQGGIVLARYPQDGALPFTVPDDSFEADNWSA